MNIKVALNEHRFGTFFVRIAIRSTFYSAYKPIFERNVFWMENVTGALRFFMLIMKQFNEFCEMFSRYCRINQAYLMFFVLCVIKIVINQLLIQKVFKSYNSFLFRWKSCVNRRKLWCFNEVFQWCLWIVLELLSDLYARNHVVSEPQLT